MSFHLRAYDANEHHSYMYAQTYTFTGSAGRKYVFSESFPKYLLHQEKSKFDKSFFVFVILSMMPIL